MLFLAGLIAITFATTTTTDDDVYCDAAAPTWFPTFAGEVMATSLASMTPPTSQQAELDAFTAATGMDFSAPYMMLYWNVDTTAHDALFNPPMRHCEVHWVCFEWAGWEYDFTSMNQQSFGQTLGNNVFLTPANAQALACSYYHCAKEFYKVSDDAITFYEALFARALGTAANGELNTDMDVSEASCSCNSELAAAYPFMNDQDSMYASAGAAQCINDLNAGGSQSGGWLWFCEKLACMTSIDSAFTDYFTCTLSDYYDVDWEACPTNMQFVIMNYGIAGAGTFMTHLLTIFILTFLSLVPCVMMYGVCCAKSKKVEPLI